MKKLILLLLLPLFALAGPDRRIDTDLLTFGTAQRRVTLQQPSALGTNPTFRLPGADGSSGQAWISNGAGVLSVGFPAVDVTALAGAGLVPNGAALDVNTDASTLEVNADQVRVKADGVKSTHILLDNATALRSKDTGGTPINLLLLNAGNDVLLQNPLSGEPIRLENAAATGVGGAITLTAGAGGTGNGGAVTITAGLGGSGVSTGGSLFLRGGGSSFGGTGSVTLESVSASGGGPTGSGGVNIKTGNAVGAATSGGISLEVGTAGTTRGNVTLDGRSIVALVESGQNLQLAAGGGVALENNNAYKIKDSGGTLHNVLILDGANDVILSNPGVGEPLLINNPAGVGSGGNIDIDAGAGGTSGGGNLFFSSGSATAGGFNTGAVILESAAAGGTSGTGAITIASGNSPGAGSGAISLTTGTASTTRGSVNLSGHAINLTVVAGQNIATTNSPRITGIADPTGAQDAATKNYVDNASRWQKFTVTHTSLQAAATTNNIELFSLAANTLLEGVVIKHSTAFAGTGITAYTVSVGIAGNLTKYASSFNVFQVVSDANRQVSSVFDIESFAGATSIRIAATSTGGNLNASTAGSVDVWVRTTKLP